MLMAIGVTRGAKRVGGRGNKNGSKAKKISTSTEKASWLAQKRLEKGKERKHVKVFTSFECAKPGMSMLMFLRSLVGEFFKKKGSFLFKEKSTTTSLLIFEHAFISLLCMAPSVEKVIPQYRFNH